MIDRIVAIVNIQDVKVKPMVSNTRHSIITPEEVSQKLNIGVERAKDISRVTTKKGD